MSSVKAVIGRQSFYGHEAELHNFDDRWVVVLNTVESGSYVLTGCVTVTNRDSDPQWASVKLVRRDSATPFLAPPEFSLTSHRRIRCLGTPRPSSTSGPFQTRSR